MTENHETNNTKEVGNAQKHYNVTRKDLPLSCPMPNMRLWDSHPRVFLAIEETGHAVCPYCEAEYTLVDK